MTVTTLTLMPPSDGSRNSITANGRLYQSTPGTAITVPYADGVVLTANGWTAPSYSAPSVSSIPGLPAIIQNGGWQILTDRPGQISGAVGPYVPTGYTAGATRGCTFRSRHRALFAATHIVLVYQNATGDNALLENPGRNPIEVACGLQKMGTSATDYTPNIIPGSFGGSMFKTISPSSGPIFSDPIPFEVAAGEVFYVCTYAGVPGPSWFIPANTQLVGGVGPACMANGDAQYADFTLSNNAFGNQTGGVPAPAYGPVAVLGFSASAQTTVAFMSDSIGQGTGDYGSLAGGWPYRFVANQTVMADTPATYGARIANFPFVQISRAGITAATVVARINSYRAMRVAEMARNVIWQLGTNDMAAGTLLATMQANTLIAANWFVQRSIKFFACTLLPRVTTTDNLRTTANQTPTAYEANRQAYNTWIRTTFVSAVNSAQGLAAILDPAAAVEVNASNVLTPNGGRWLLPPTTSDASGSATSTGAVGNFTDTNLGNTLDQWRGYNLIMTSGIGVNGTTNNAIIRNPVGANNLTLASNLPGAPSSGDTYIIFRPTSQEGTHPTAYGNQLVANSLNIPSVLSQFIS